MKGTDLFLQVLNERLGVTPPKNAQTRPGRKPSPKATIIVAALAAGVLLSSLCSGQTVQDAAGASAAPSAPAAAAPAPAETKEAAPAAKTEAAPAATGAKEATPGPSTKAESSRRAHNTARTSRARETEATPAQPVKVTPATTQASYAMQQAHWGLKGEALGGAEGITGAAVDPESLPIESYHVPSKSNGGGNVILDVFTKLVLVVILMLGCAAGWKRLQGMPNLRGAAPVESMEMLETFNLAPQRQLHVVKVSGQRLLIGSTPGSVSLIVELDKPAASAASTAVINPILETETDEEPISSFEQVIEEIPNRYEQIMTRLREKLVPTVAAAVDEVEPEPVHEPAPAALFRSSRPEPVEEPEPVATAASKSGLFGRSKETKTSSRPAMTATSTLFFSTAGTPGVGGQDA